MFTWLHSPITLTYRYATDQSFPTDLFAVSLLHDAILHSFVATVTAIVLAAFIVILIITIAISLVLTQSARSRRLTKIVWIDALAL